MDVINLYQITADAFAHRSFSCINSEFPENIYGKVHLASFDREFSSTCTATYARVFYLEHMIDKVLALYSVKK